jgi:hypothetical protein
VSGLQGSGYKVLGVTVQGPAPLGRIHLELSPDLSVLYGLNGSGKTRVLDGVVAALGGRALPGGRRWVHLQIDDRGAGADEGFPGALFSAMRADMLTGETIEELVLAVLSGLDQDYPLIEPLVAEASASGLFSLEATGTTHAEWRIWVSGPADEGSPLGEAAQAVTPLARQHNEFLRQLQEAAPEDVNLTEALHELEAIIAAIRAIPPWDHGNPALEELAEGSLFTRPQWVPLQIAPAGSISAAPVDVVSVDTEVPGVDVRTARSLTSRAYSGIFDDVAAARLLEEASDRVGELTESATRAFRAVVGAGPALRRREPGARRPAAARVEATR